MNKQQNSKAGFSLVEVLVTMVISVFILASSYATIISLAKGSESMINFSEMNTQTRVALEVFARDARMCADVHTFELDKSTRGAPPRIGPGATLLFDVEEMNFFYYRLVDPDIPNYDPIAQTKLEVKHVQLEAKLRRSVLNLDNTNYILSARFMMRNKDVGE